jgi:hypothetical protein
VNPPKIVVNTDINQKNVKIDSGMYDDLLSWIFIRIENDIENRAVYNKNDIIIL